MDTEKIGLKKNELTEKYQILVEKLRPHEDLRLVKKIIECIEFGFLDDAKKFCFTEADKFRQFPEVIEILSNFLFEPGEEKPWGMSKRLEERKMMETVRTEEGYVTAVAEYALAGGWVKPEQKEILVREYLKPIHRKYIEILKQIDQEIGEENALVRREVVRKMNAILDSTKRIGSTDLNNIIRSIQDYKERFGFTNDYVEFALEDLVNFIADLLYSKS